MKNIKNKKALEDMCWRLERFSTAFTDLKSVCDISLTHLEQLKRARNPAKIAKLKMLIRYVSDTLDVDDGAGIFEGCYRGELEALESDVYNVLGATQPASKRESVTSA